MANRNKYSTAELTEMKKKNELLLQLLNEAGVNTSPLVEECVAKNGRKYKRASNALNTFRKVIYEESLETPPSETKPQEKKMPVESKTAPLPAKQEEKKNLESKENSVTQKEEKVIEVSEKQVVIAKKEKKTNKFIAFFTNRFTIFGIILLFIVASIFFLFMVDESSYLRPEALNDSIFQDFAKIYGLEKFNVHSGSYFILFIFCAFVLLIGIFAFLKKPMQEKYEYNYTTKKQTDSVPMKIIVKFLTFFYTIASIIGVTGFTVFFIIYPYETMNWSEAAEPLTNVMKSLGLFFGSLFALIIAIVLLVTLLNLIGKIFRKKPKTPKKVK